MVRFRLAHAMLPGRSVPVLLPERGRHRMRTRPNRALLIEIGIWVGAVLMLFAGPVYAHPGNTDSRGGHACRTNCERWGLSYGQYHYHGTRSTSAAIMRATPQLPAAKKGTTWKWLVGIGAGIAALYWLGNHFGSSRKRG